MQTRTAKKYYGSFFLSFLYDYQSTFYAKLLLSSSSIEKNYWEHFKCLYQNSPNISSFFLEGSCIRMAGKFQVKVGAGDSRFTYKVCKVWNQNQVSFKNQVIFFSWLRGVCAIYQPHPHSNFKQITLAPIFKFSTQGCVSQYGNTS